MSTEAENSGHARMRPRARLISLLGDELISDEPVAVVELVKNAYDADATTVTVRFEGPENTLLNKLVISDNGIGMSLDTVLKGWFEPGTVIKKRALRSPSGRFYQGAKGIGRFASARLAKSLYMETREGGQQDGVVVLLDWGKFDDESYLDQIEINYGVESLPELEHGTKLELLDLRKTWTEEDFRNLHNRLSRLISPFQRNTGEAEISDFSIDLDIPGYPNFTGKVEAHKLTHDPKYRLSGSLSDRGTFSGRLEIDGKLAKAYEPPKVLATKDDTLICGPFEVEIRAWDRDRTGLSPFLEKYDQSLTAIRKTLDEYCGVAIYRDGFRVYPYGEKGNDWLSLDTRSRQTPTRCLANNQIIAAIRISRDGNPDLNDRTTREGLVHNDAYRSLINWFTRVLSLLEEERYKVRPRVDLKPEEVSSVYEVFDMSEVVQQIGRELGPKHPIAQLVRDKESDIREGIRRLQEHYSRVLLAAGLGQIVDVVIHEIGAPLGRLSRELSHIERQLTDAIANRVFDKLLGSGASERLGKSFTQIKAWIEQIANLRERLIPKAAAKRVRATDFSVQDEIRDNLGLYENLISRQKIKVTLHAPRDPLSVRMPRSNLGQVVANLLDNSVYWVTRHHGEGNGGQINIRLTRLKHGFRISLSDDGPGVSEEDRERIFEQEFSRKPNGMGLGLFIAREVIEPYGKLIYKDDCSLPGACFEATFDKRVGL